jgi:nitrogen fixation protein FixH
MTPREFRLTGRHVLAMMVLFFGIIIAVNAFFVTMATRTFSGEEVSKAYLHGLDYNTVLERRAAQKALGWTSRVAVQEGTLLLTVAAPDGPVAGLALEGALKHPADTARDRPLVLTDAGEGRYTAPLGDIAKGQWTLWVQTTEGEPFEVEQRLWMQ